MSKVNVRVGYIFRLQILVNNHICSKICILFWLTAQFPWDFSVLFSWVGFLIIIWKFYLSEIIVVFNGAFIIFLLQPHVRYVGLFYIFFGSRKVENNRRNVNKKIKLFIFYNFAAFKRTSYVGFFSLAWKIELMSYVVFSIFSLVWEWWKKNCRNVTNQIKFNYLLFIRTQ